MILAGDYNSSPRLVGPAATFPREPRSDEPELSNLLDQHRLVALNTWQPLSPHTFVQGDARTQIDFMLTRQISAGRQAKQASPLLDFPLGSWKKCGHRPIQAFVTPVRHWNLPGPQIKPLQHDSAALQEAVRANSPQAQRVLAWGTEHLDLDSRPQAWDELLIGATERFFPKTAVALPDCPEVAAARRLCSARRGDANRPSTELLAEQHSALQDQHKQAVKQARKDKAARFLQEVDQVITREDQHVVYQILKMLQPWKTALKAQLKDKHGFLLSPANELKELGPYATQAFAAHPKLPEHTGSMPQLEPAKLARHIAFIKPGKAVPKGSAPAAAWQLCARPVSQVLARYCDSLDTRQHLDDALTRADLCLIPTIG